MDTQTQGRTVIWMQGDKRAELTCRNNKWSLIYNPDMGFCSSITAIGYDNVVEILTDLLGFVDAGAMLLAARIADDRQKKGA